jgi:hypothetical protein
VFDGVQIYVVAEELVDGLKCVVGELWNDIRPPPLGKDEVCGAAAKVAISYY